MDDVAVELRAGRQAVADGTRAQQRKARKDSWTRAQEREFLEVLATTCNVSEAARVAGVRRAGAYERRQRDARFAADWDRAIDIGYAEIEVEAQVSRPVSVELVNSWLEAGKVRLRPIPGHAGR